MRVVPVRGKVADFFRTCPVTETLHPFMAAEMGSVFRLEEALTTGMLPLVHGAVDPAEILRAYNGLYLREEVQAEGLVRNTGAFSRFLEAISFSQASVLNLANVARECQVNRKSVEGYIEILEDLLLAFRVPVFTRRAKRELAAHPKFFFFDAGVFRANRPTGPLDSPRTSMARRLKAWWPSTSAPGAITAPESIVFTTGRPAPRWKWTSSSMGRTGFMPWK